MNGYSAYRKWTKTTWNDHEYARAEVRIFTLRLFYEEKQAFKAEWKNLFIENIRNYFISYGKSNSVAYSFNRN